MKTKYTNQSYGMRRVVFADGTTQFLVRGETIVSGKQAAKVEDGIHSIPVRSTRSKIKQDNEEQETE